MYNQNEKLNKILQKYDGVITGPNDLTGGEDPSKLFYFLANHLSYLLDINPENAISEKGVERRRKLNFIIKNFGDRFLLTPQIFENRNFLKNPQATEISPDLGITVPDEPVIWIANHAFKDDVLATTLAANRHAYLLCGSIPHFYNMFEGIIAWMNGVVLTNRKVSVSRHSVISKAEKVMQFGADMLIFPEGVWNKSPNALILDLWPGIYRIACETGAKIVPVVHYIRDCTEKEKNNPIHTVVDDPIRIDNLSERAAMAMVRDVLATWFYLMMEVYGKSTREEALQGLNTATKVWEQSLTERVEPVGRYDIEIERRADYRPKWKIAPQQVWQPIADISTPNKNNVLDVEYARQVIRENTINDFQRRF